MSDAHYENIREFLGEIVGATILEITQHDEEDFQRGEEPYVALHLSTGATLTFLIPVEGGFTLELPDGRVGRGGT